MSESNTSNDSVFEYLRTRAQPGAEPVSPPGEPFHDYMESGAHPDIVERLWKDLDNGLPADSRMLVYGTPVLMNPETSEILAVAIGTSYAVRLPPELSDCHPDGTSSVITWSAGKTTDLATVFGTDWVVGTWNQLECEWVKR